MLVLSRKAGEGIVLGDGIRITVVRVSPGNVRLGVEAPEGTPIARQEVHQHQAPASEPHQTELPQQQ